MNQIVLIGRLTRDVELRYISGSGTPVANFALAVDREFSGKDGKKEVDFIEIQVWGKSGENCANYIGKGSLVGVQGSLRIESYQDQSGQNKKTARVNANRVQFLDSKKSENGNNGGNGNGYSNNGNKGYENNKPKGNGTTLSFDDFDVSAISNDDLPFTIDDDNLPYGFGEAK